MTYLFLGDDSASKDKKIAEFKKKICKSKDSSEFDYEVLHAFKLDPPILKKALLALPVIAKQRLIVIRECHKLTQQNRDILKEFIKKADDSFVLILDSNELKEENIFTRELKKHLKVIVFARKEERDAFELTRAIASKRKTEALKILSELFAQGEHPLKVMGAIVWFWRKSRNKMPSYQFKKGLLALEEADYNIKRSRLKPEYALELLVVKLCF